MTGEALFEAFAAVDDRFLAEAEARRKPVQKPVLGKKAEKQKKQRVMPVFGGAQPVGWRSVFATAACAVLLVGALCLVPVIMHSGQQIGTASPTVEPAGGVYVDEHYHVIFRGFSEIDQLLLLEKQGDALTAHLKESGLWSQGIKTEDDVLAIREIIRGTPIPTLRGREPKALELVEGKAGIAAEFDELSLFVNSHTLVNAWPSGAVQVSEDPVLFLVESQETVDGDYVFHFAGSAYDHQYSATLQAADLNSALEVLGTLEFRLFGQDNMAGMDAWWEFDEETGTLRLFTKGYSGILMGENGSAVEATYTLLHGGVVHGADRAEDVPWYEHRLDIRHVQVEQGICKLGRGVFRELENLQTVSLPVSLLEIGSDNFVNCGMEHIAVPGMVGYIGGGFAHGCDQLRSVVFRSAQWASSGAILTECPKLQYVQWAGKASEWRSVVLSVSPGLAGLEPLCAADALEGDGGWQRYGFVQWRYDEGTKTLAIKGAGQIEDKFTESYPWYALRDEVEHLVLDDGITGTDTNVFPFSKLKDVYLPPSLVEMGNLLLADCSTLEYVLIPEYATELPNGLFSGCGKLEYVAIPGGVTRIGSMAFYTCRSLKTLRIPDGVSFIGDSAFSECTSLQEIRLPDSLRQVRMGVFYGCSGLRSVTMPASIKLLDSASFSGCTVLTDVYFAGTREQWEKVNTTEYTKLPENVTVHCADETGEPVIPLVDTYVGTYQNGKWELEHVVDAHTDVQITVLELTVSHDAHHDDAHHGSEGYITLELLSETEQTVELRLVSSASDDNLATILNETIPMKAGQKTNYIPLRFEGWSAFSYELCIEAGNTRIVFTIYPPVEE